eukprot:94669-Alexandrium_andersonii.AAC.1
MEPSATENEPTERRPSGPNPLAHAANINEQRPPGSALFCSTAELGRRLTYTDKCIRSAANACSSLQGFAA